MSTLVCPDCGSSSYLIVDGRRMEQGDLLALSHAPRSIKRRLPHAIWCPSMDHRMQLAARTPSEVPE